MPSQIITENLALKAANSLSRLKSTGTAANKLKALIAANKHGVKKVSDVFGVSRTAIYRWASELDNKGLEALINNPKHCGGLKLTTAHRSVIKEWLSKNPNLSIAKVKDKIEKKFDIIVSRSTVHRAMKESGFSYITPRKQHYKQDKTEVEEFKKKSSK